MQNTSPKKTKFKTPYINSQYGFLYPLVWEALEFWKYFSPYYHLKINNSISSDAYITFWLIHEAFAVILLEELWIQENEVMLIIISIIFIHRYLDIMFLLSSMLVRRFVKYNPKGQIKSSANRTVLLTTINFLEIIIIFSIINFSFSKIPSINLELMPPLGNMIDAFYYSVATSLTLGANLPGSNIAKIISLTQVLSIFTVIINILGFVISSRKVIPDQEQGQEGKIQ